MKKYTLLFFLVFGFWTTHAQKVKKFSQDSHLFMEELQAFLTKDLEKNRGEILFGEFAPAWQSGSFEMEQEELIIKTCNNFLKKRIVDIDHWEYWLRSAVQMAVAEDVAIITPWLTFFEEKSRRGKSGDIRNYIAIIHNVLFDQTFIDNGTIRWKVYGENYEILYEDELVVQVTEADIWGFYKTDSTVIETTSGRYIPSEMKFIGDGGMMYWRRAGLNEDSAQAELRNYTIQANKTQFKADSVMLKTFLFPEPILGVVEERLTTKTEKNNATFPRFYSYEHNVSRENIYPDVDYIGGFSLIGNKFYASGELDNPAKLLFKYEDRPLIRIESQRFLLKEKVVSSSESKATLYIDKDSLYHPKVSMRFRPDNGQLYLNRAKEGVSKAPFINTYHDLDLYFDAFTWVQGQPLVHISNLNLGAVSPVVFESQSYFRNERFEAIRGLNDVNPLYDIQSAVDMYGRNIISLDEMAGVLMMDKRNCHRFMLEMVVQGFVLYDQEKEMITVKDKVANYINNYEEKIDFDVIRFVSGLESGANASISLMNYDMEIRGINAIALSDSQQVALFPKGRKITVHEGLDFDFDGRIAAGRFSFWGNEFFFDYNLFQVNMANIDSMRFKVESFEADMNGNRKLVNVRNTLQNINGELLIDKPDNKSGMVRHTEYPIFRSGRESYVYYDRPGTFGGVYDQERFFVELEPFEIDSLDNTTTEGLKFHGVLNSAGIFPDMEEDLTVQEDYSLGFKTATPEGGYMAYGGKGNYEGDLKLSLEGFRGEGDIDYLFSNAKSEEFLFFPDSTNGVAYEYEIQEQVGGINNPHVVGTNVWVNWRPMQDVFYASNREAPFDMYDEIGMKTTGRLAYSPSKLGGRVKTDFLDAQANSNNMWFKNRELSADSMAFRVRANPEADWGFQLMNAKGWVNFDKEKGQFTKNNPAGYLEFPINQYIGFMDFAEWFIPEKAVEVQKKGEGASSHMVSVHPNQDSLQFMAGSAKFFLEPSLLENYDVPHIDVADARIFPDSGYVAVDPKAQMRPLEKASMEANRETKYHKFFDGTFYVKARMRYFGMAHYEYIDEDETAWPLYFEEIKVDTSGTTIGLADVAKEDEFYLSPFFGYYGKVHLTAPDQYMVFDGYTLIQQTCDNIETTWFKFKSEIDPKQIVIDLPEDNPTTRGDDLNNGIYIAPDSTSGYSAFLTPTSSMADQELIGATGVLYYDKEANEYVVTLPEMVDNPEAKGNTVRLDNKNCFTYGEGALTYSPKMGQVSLSSYGVVTHDLQSDEISMDLLLGFDFFFDEGILEQIAEEVNSAESASGLKTNRDAYKIALNHLLSPKDRVKYDESVELFGGPDKVPKALRNTFTFGELILYWTPETNSFVSDGPVGIGSILDIPVNRNVEGIVEVVRKSRGDEMYIYFELDGGEYYYFQYKRNQLQFYTNNKEIMTAFREIDPKKRSLSAKDGMPAYKYNPSTKGKVNLFLSKFE